MNLSIVNLYLKNYKRQKKEGS